MTWLENIYNSFGENLLIIVGSDAYLPLLIILGIIAIAAYFFVASGPIRVLEEGKPWMKK